MDTNSLNLRRNGCEFTYAEYGQLIRQLCARGYVPTFFGESKKDALALYLRHDVDYSLSSAVEMARYESSCNVRSTYFLMLRSQAYNLLSEEGGQAVADILSCGHRLGLHYPPGQDANDIVRDCAVLRYMFGADVGVVSSHKPDQIPGPTYIASILGRPLLNAYGPAYMAGYTSDSFGVWRFGHPLNSPWVAAGTSGCLLTHPEWWSFMGRSRTETLVRLLHNSADERQRYIEREILDENPYLVTKLRKALQQGV